MDAERGSGEQDHLPDVDAETVRRHISETAAGVFLVALRERRVADLEARKLFRTGTPHALDDPYFQLVFQGSGLGIALIGTDGKSLCSNPALVAMLGYSVAEFRRMAFSEFTHPEDVALDLHLHRELLDGKRRGYHIDKRYIAKDGRTVHARITVALAPGDAAHLVGMVEDVSAEWAAADERDRALLQLGDRVKQLTALHGATRILQNDALGVPEMLRAIVDLIPAAFQFSAITVARLSAGDAVYETPRFAEALATIRSEFGPEGNLRGALDVGYLEVRPASDEGPFRSEERLLLETLGELVGAALERRRAQERLDLAVTAGRINIWEWDIPSGRLAWPGQAGKPMGPGQWGRAATIDAFIAMVHPEDRARVPEAIRAALEDPAFEGRYGVELRVIDSDGRICWLLAGGQVFRDSTGKPERVLGVATEVTERHAMEESLRQVQKMESIGRLASGISHDFNNLLMSILGYSDLAARSLPAGSPAGGYLHELSKAGATATGLVCQLLAFARKQELKPRAIRLRVILGEMESMLRRLVKGGVSIVTDFEEGVPEALADPIQVQQVVLNLALNARDAMPQGGDLTLRTRRRTCPPPAEDGGSASEREWAVLEVEDTGAGMTPEVRERLFEPFFTTKPEGQGTGLGLATVYGIVRQSGGFLEVESTLGVGTLFRIHLPTA